MHGPGGIYPVEERLIKQAADEEIVSLEEN